MKVLYLDCGMGAAGDMLGAALLELLPDKETFVAELNSLGIPGVKVSREEEAKCGIKGTHFVVKVDGVEESEEMHAHGHEHGHHHSGMHEIGHVVEDLPVSEKVKMDILAVYSLIAKAESHVHGVPVEEIHFHEVGTMDAVMDIAAVCMLMERLAPEKVVVSPVCVGGGHVQCAHGILPVPAPATAYILQDVPIYGGDIKSELCTPTGAALVKYFATEFGSMPLMRTSLVGYGMGTKDFPVANCVRAFLGNTEDAGDAIVELCCNLDDMTAEALAFAEEQLLASGALEVYAVPVQMKKSRLGSLLTLICHEQDTSRMVQLMFRYTTTLGVRERRCNRYTLSRTVKTEETEFGEVRKKVSSGYGVTKEKYEYEDLAHIARKQGMSLTEVMAWLQERNNQH